MELLHVTMNRDSLVIVGVVLITLIVLGSAYMAVSRGVAPSLLEKGATGGSKQGTGSSQPTSGKTTATSTKKTTTQKTTQKAPFDFKSVFLKKTEFSITYDYYQDLKKKGSGALYVKGADKRRMDFKFVQGQTILINNGDLTIYCFKQAQTDWQCFQSKNKKSIEKKMGGKANDPVEEGQEEFTKPVYNGTRKYAGKTCYCYYISKSGKATVNGVDKMGTQWIEICVTQDGIPAYYLYLWKSSDGKNTIRTEIIAKTISYSVPDSVFNPPVEPTNLP